MEVKTWVAVCILFYPISWERWRRDCKYVRKEQTSQRPLRLYPMSEITWMRDIEIHWINVSCTGIDLFQCVQCTVYLREATWRQLLKWQSHLVSVSSAYHFLAVSSLPMEAHSPAATLGVAVWLCLIPEAENPFQPGSPTQNSCRCSVMGKEEINFRKTLTLSYMKDSLLLSILPPSPWKDCWTLIC